VHVSNELYMIIKLLVLHSYEVISKCCIGFPIFNYSCPKVCKDAPKISEIAPKFSQVGPNLVIDES
jgi:hypothetical protein